MSSVLLVEDDEHLAEGMAFNLQNFGYEVETVESGEAALLRIADKLMPEPEPPLKMIPSSRYQLRMPSIVSSTDRMKQALTCCGALVPTLNQTGELKLNTWCSSIHVSSCSKTSASCGVAK